MKIKFKHLIKWHIFERKKQYEEIEGELIGIFNVEGYGTYYDILANEEIYSLKREMITEINGIKLKGKIL